MSMKRQTIATRAALTAALFSAGLLFAAPAAQAGGTTPVVTASNAWVRWLPNGLPAAGYVTLKNGSDKNVDLTEASSPDYDMVMLHQTVSNGSTQQMVMVDKATVPAHGTLAIAPGGYHFMLEQAKHAIKVGDTVHMTLDFSDGSKLDVPFTVKSPAQAQ